MSQEQDAVFFRNFTLVMVMLTVFGVFAAIMGRYFGALAQKDQAHSAVPSTAAAAAKE